VTILRVVLPSLTAIVVFGLALSVDRKLRRMQGEVHGLRDKMHEQQMAMMDMVNSRGLAAPASPEKVNTIVTPSANIMAAQAITSAVASTPVKTAAVSKRDVPMIDVDKVPRTLTNYFGMHNFHPTVYDQATDYVQVRIANPPVVIHAAVIDLRTPGLEVKVGGTLTGKTLTTDFARNNDCTISINGEAGASPQLNSGFGEWIGHFIIKGQVLIKERPGNKRPFLSFDKQNHAVFTSMAAADRGVGPTPYNVIWGRLDAVINGKIQTENERDRQPRTAMGIDKDGTRLFLVVIDGRQQQYSMGFTRAETGAFLHALGAYNGMLCDEGGSSSMYVKKLGGIVNSPSDGEERPTYTHFGISLN